MAEPVGNLGQYIYLMNPYVPFPFPVGAGQPPVPPFPLGTPPVPPPLGWDFAPAFIAAPPPAAIAPVADEMYGLLLQEAEVQAYPGQMYFRGTERYVARALRIPYIYYKASATNGAGIALVREQLLIGYEGSGGGI